MRTRQKAYSLRRLGFALRDDSHGYDKPADEEDCNRDQSVVERDQELDQRGDER